MDKATVLLDQVAVGKTALLQNSYLWVHTEIVFSVLVLQHVSLFPLLVAPLQGYLSLTAGLLVFWVFSTFLPPCEIPTDWFQRKASATFSAELLKSKVTAILCLWNNFSLAYLQLLWVRIRDLPHPSCSWAFYFFCCEISWSKVNLTQTQTDYRGIYTAELRAAVSRNAWWFTISFLVLKVINYEDAGMLVGLDKVRSLKHFYFTKGS